VFTVVDVDDVASAVLVVLDRPDVAAGQIFNIGETGSYRVRAWLRLILDAAGSDAVLVTVPDEVLPDDLRLTRTHPQHLLATSAKAERVLGWRATPTAEAVARSVRWHLDHPGPIGSFESDDAALSGAEPDVALVLAAYEAFGRGDIDAAVARLHPDVDWIEPDEFPNGGVRHGQAAVAAYLRASHESWRERRSELTAHRRGERILIVHHVSGVLGDGTPHDATVADVFTVRDGLVVHMIAYGDPAEAFATHPA
jgi:ketosteroid isomerase-like protein